MPPVGLMSNFPPQAPSKASDSQKGIKLTKVKEHLKVS